MQRKPLKTASCYQVLWTMPNKSFLLQSFSKTRISVLGAITEQLSEGCEFEAKGIIGRCPNRWTIMQSVQ